MGWQEDLRQYISNELRAGKTPVHIERELLQIGWKEEMYAPILHEMAPEYLGPDADSAHAAQPASPAAPAQAASPATPLYPSQPASSPISSQVAASSSPTPAVSPAQLSSQPLASSANPKPAAAPNPAQNQYPSDAHPKPGFPKMHLLIAAVVLVIIILGAYMFVSGKFSPAPVTPSPVTNASSTSGLNSSQLSGENSSQATGANSSQNALSGNGTADACPQVKAYLEKYKSGEWEVDFAVPDSGGKVNILHNGEKHKAMLFDAQGNDLMDFYYINSKMYTCSNMLGDNKTRCVDQTTLIDSIGFSPKGISLFSIPSVANNITCKPIADRTIAGESAKCYDIVAMGAMGTRTCFDEKGRILSSATISKAAAPLSSDMKVSESQSYWSGARPFQIRASKFAGGNLSLQIYNVQANQLKITKISVAGGGSSKSYGTPFLLSGGEGRNISIAMGSNPCASGDIYEYMINISYDGTGTNPITGQKQYGTKTIVGKCNPNAPPTASPAVENWSVYQQMDAVSVKNQVADSEFVLPASPAQNSTPPASGQNSGATPPARQNQSGNSSSQNAGSATAKTPNPANPFLLKITSLENNFLKGDLQYTGKDPITITAVMCTLGPAEYTDGQVREFVQVNGLDASYLGQGIVGGQILKLGTRDSIGLYNSCVDDFTSEQFSGYSTGANTFNGIVYIVGPDYIYRFNVTNVPLIQTI